MGIDIYTHLTAPTKRQADLLKEGKKIRDEVLRIEQQLTSGNVQDRAFAQRVVTYAQNRLPNIAREVESLEASKKRNEPKKKAF